MYDIRNFKKDSNTCICTRNDDETEELFDIFNKIGLTWADGTAYSKNDTKRDGKNQRMLYNSHGRCVSREVHERYNLDHIMFDNIIDFSEIVFDENNFKCESELEIEDDFESLLKNELLPQTTKNIIIKKEENDNMGTLNENVKTTLEGKTAVKGANGYYTIENDGTLARCFNPLDNISDIRTKEKQELDQLDIILYENKLAYVVEVCNNKYEIIYFENLKSDTLVKIKNDGMTDGFKVIVNPIEFQLAENKNTSAEELLSTVESNSGKIMMALSIKQNKTQEVTATNTLRLVEAMMDLVAKLS